MSSFTTTWHYAIHWLFKTIGLVFNSEILESSARFESWWLHSSSAWILTGYFNMNIVLPTLKLDTERVHRPLHPVKRLLGEQLLLPTSWNLDNIRRVSIQRVLIAHFTSSQISIRGHNAACRQSEYKLLKSCNSCPQISSIYRLYSNPRHTTFKACISHIKLKCARRRIVK